MEQIKFLKANKINLPKTAIKVYNTNGCIVNNLSFGEIALLRSTIKALLGVSDSGADRMLLNNTTEVLLDILIQNGRAKWKGVVTKDGYFLRVKKEYMHLIDKYAYNYLIDANEIYEVLEVNLADLMKEFKEIS